MCTSDCHSAQSDSVPIEQAQFPGTCGLLFKATIRAA